MRSTAEIEGAVRAAASGVTASRAAAGVGRTFERARVASAVDGAGTALDPHAINGAVTAGEEDSTRARLIFARQLSSRSAPDNRPSTTSRTGAVDRTSRRRTAVDRAACALTDAVDLARGIRRARHAAAAGVVATSDVTSDSSWATNGAWALPCSAVDVAGGSIAVVARTALVRCGSARAAVRCARNGCAAPSERGSLVGSERVRVLQTRREHQRKASHSVSRSTAETKQNLGARVARHSRRRVCHFGDAA